jgi:hypothetical protein
MEERTIRVHSDDDYSDTSVSFGEQGWVATCARTGQIWTAPTPEVALYGLVVARKERES